MSAHIAGWAWPADLVFVDLDGTAAPTAEQWGPMSEQIAEYGLADWKIVESAVSGHSAWDWKMTR